MRQLLPSPADHVDLPTAYAYPEDGTWVRANMVMSLDGSAVQHGRSEGLSGAADKEVFGVLRGLADVVLVGAGTARAEGYRAPRAKAEHADQRQARGQLLAPVLALVSRGLDLDPASALFTGDHRTVVITHRRSDPARRRRLGEVADVLVAGEDQVDVQAALAGLVDRSLLRVLCEGGPTLLTDVIAADRLDELCLTLSSKTVGGDGTRITNGDPLDESFALAHLLEQDGTLFARYVRR